MTQEDKELLLKDLCARLPYGVKCYIPEINIVRTLGTVQYDEENTLFDFWNETHTRYEHQLYLSEFKPYLSPMSSITDRQYDIMYGMIENDRHDWLNANHFDYRGLIEKGLALDATGLNVY